MCRGGVVPDVPLHQFFPTQGLRGVDDVADDPAAVLVEGIPEGGEGRDVAVADVGEGEGGDYGGAQAADVGGGVAEGAEEPVEAGLDGGAVVGYDLVF